MIKRTNKRHFHHYPSVRSLGGGLCSVTSILLKPWYRLCCLHERVRCCWTPQTRSLRTEPLWVMGVKKNCTHLRLCAADYAQLLLLHAHTQCMPPRSERWALPADPSSVSGRRHTADRQTRPVSASLRLLPLLRSFSLLFFSEMSRVLMDFTAVCRHNRHQMRHSSGSRMAADGDWWRCWKLFSAEGEVLTQN